MAKAHYRENGTVDEASFDTWEEFNAFLASEREYWNWLLQSDAGGGARIVREKMVAGFSAARRAASQIVNQGGQPNRGGNMIAERFRNDADALISSRSDIAREVAEVREAVSDEAAAFVAGFLRGFVTLAEASSRDDILGALWIASPGLVGSAGLSELLKRERENARTTVRKIKADADAADASRREHWDDLIGAARLQSLRWARRRSRRWKVSSEHWEDRHRRAESDIRAVESSYREAMSLQAPVEYWKKKAADHAKAERKARLWVQIYFPTALAFLVVAFWGVGTRLLDVASAHPATPLPSGIYLIASAGLASAAGVLFWIGRLLTKLFLSEHHLRHDAEERATMTTTYLALVAEKGAEETDRQIVLTALFRSTPDGIVKEEGGLDPSLASALGRFLAR